MYCCRGQCACDSQHHVCMWLCVTFFLCVHRFFTFQKTGLLRPTPLVREAWKNCWNWANTVKDMMCDISHLSHHQQQQQKTTSNEPMVWYWYLWSQEEQGWMIQKPTFVFGNAWKISLALSSWGSFTLHVSILFLLGFGCDGHFRPWICWDGSQLLHRFVPPPPHHHQWHSLNTLNFLYQK